MRRRNSAEGGGVARALERFGGRQRDLRRSGSQQPAVPVVGGAAVGLRDAAQGGFGDVAVAVVDQAQEQRRVAENGRSPRGGAAQLGLAVAGESLRGVAGVVWRNARQGEDRIGGELP